MVASWEISENDANRVIQLVVGSKWSYKRVHDDMPYVSRFQIRRVVLYFKRRGIVPFRGFDNPDAGLDEKEMGMIKDILALDCTLYLDEIALKLWGLTNVYRSESQICRALLKMGLTLKAVMPCGL
jgi:hypothetical protein